MERLHYCWFFRLLIPVHSLGRAKLPFFVLQLKPEGSSDILAQTSRYMAGAIDGWAKEIGNNNAVIFGGYITDNIISIYEMRADPTSEKRLLMKEIIGKPLNDPESMIMICKFISNLMYDASTTLYENLVKVRLTPRKEGILIISHVDEERRRT